MEFIRVFDETNVTVVKENGVICMSVNEAAELLEEYNALIPFIYRLGEPRNITDFLISAAEDSSDDFDVFDLIINVIFLIVGEKVEMCCTFDLGMEYEGENGEKQRSRLANQFPDIPLANWEREYIKLIYESVRRES